jgi:hypothetical protein
MNATWHYQCRWNQHLQHDWRIINPLVHTAVVCQEKIGAMDVPGGSLVGVVGEVSDFPLSIYARARRLP